MRIINEEGAYWTEGKGKYTSEDGDVRKRLDFWSKFEPSPNDKRDFFIVKAILLFLMMRMFKVKCKLERRTAE